MFLDLPILDEVKTAANVRKYLNHDYPKYCTVIGKPVSYVKATTYDGMPKSPVALNKTDEAIINRVDFEVAVDWTREAFKQLSMYNPENAKLLYEANILKKDRQVMADERIMHKDTLRKKLQVARCQFAGYLADISKNRLNLLEWQ